MKLSYSKTARTTSGQFFLVGALLLAGAVTTRAQVYSVSAPVTGYQEIALSDRVNQNSYFGGTPAYTSMLVNFGTLSERIYLDQDAGTIRQVGSLTLSPTTANLSFSGYNSGPGFLSGTVSATLTIAGGGPLTFDTGPIPYASGGGTFGVNFSLAIPVSGTYSLVTGGQTYSGNLDYQQVQPMLTTILSSVTPHSLSISQSASTAEFGSILVDVTAANGYHMRLENGADDGTSYFQWQMNAATTLTVVPEPNAGWVLGLGLAGLVFWRRCAGRKIAAKN